MKIIVNKAKCKRCGDVIISKQSDTYEYCKCGSIAVSGGTKSIMRLGHHTNIQELSEKDYF
ncbi:MAG: hypothetical protein JEZ08_20075 [Clostridiales bacterium]|nr:hypothetical protein [Clostridiales bacterium]